jgi:hypothetical protein
MRALTAQSWKLKLAAVNLVRWIPKPGVLLALGDGALSYFESGDHSALAHLLGLDVGDCRRYSSRSNPCRFQDFLRPHQTNGASGGISELNVMSLTQLSPARSSVRHWWAKATYDFGETITYVTRGGKVLDEDAVGTNIKVGVQARVHCVREGDNMLVDRVILEED